MRAEQRNIDEGHRRMFAVSSRFLRLWIEHAVWSRHAFGPDDYRGPLGPIRHLRKEAAELEQAPQDRMEYADCLLLLIDAARRAGMEPEDLLDAAMEKLAVNKRRTWPDWRLLPSDLAIEHERDGGK